MTNLFRKYGDTLLDNGFNFIPIKSATAKSNGAGKAPVLKEWVKSKIDSEMLVDWTKRFNNCGIGILTKNTPAVDIDCLDPEISLQMKNFVEENIGFAPVRIGRSPKMLLLFRTDQPFTKVKSAVWEDDFGQNNAVEILATGQQFVAFGTHPTTKKPYEWVSIESPLDQHAALDLEPITIYDARMIADEFDRVARDLGWIKVEEPKHGSILGEVSDWTNDDVDSDDWVDVDDVKDKWEGSYQKLYDLIMDLPPAEEYSAWVPVLAALKDAEREPDEFKEIARDWSALANNYDDAAFSEKWENGNFKRIGQFAATVSGLVKRVEDARLELDVNESIIPLFERAIDLFEWDRAAERLRHTPVFGTIRNHAVVIACDAYQRITGKKIPPDTKKRALAIDYTQFDAPKWVAPWVFNQSECVFINKETGARAIPHAFNNTHAEETIDIGCTPEVFATALRPIPVVNGSMYYPAAHGKLPDNIWKPVRGVEGEEFFSYNGLTWLNSFRPETLPTMPDKFSSSDLKAIEVVKNYFATQFTDRDEHRHVMDWLAWVINNPGKKINYALIILGGEGSGKSIIKKFMTFLLGPENVGTVSNQVLHKSFSSWQAGHILKVIEEISVAGHRYDIMNILKEPISNENLQIERKNKDAIDHVNTASYMAYTNDIAALPITTGNRRFLIVRSQFRSKDEVQEFSKFNPKFFKNFEQAFTRHAGAICKWFKDWKYSDGFNHQGHAPKTESLEEMAETATDDFSSFVLDCIADGGFLGVTSELIHSNKMLSHVPKELIPSRRFLSSRLSELGFYKLGRNRTQIRLNGSLGTVYVKDPKRWVFANGRPNFDKIKKFLDAHVEKLEKIESENWS